MTTSRVVRLAAVQASPAFLDREKTLARLGEWARRAANDGAQVIAFGETWVSGYPAWLDSSPEAALWGHAGGKALFARLCDNAVEVPGAATEAVRTFGGAVQGREAGVLHVAAGNRG